MSERLVRPLLRVAVDEADEVEAVFGVLPELLRHELADVARADDDRVLDVGEMLPRDRARAIARPAVMQMIAKSQKPRSRAKPGSARWVTAAKAKKSQLPTVTRWRTPTRSSAVEWSVRSSSKS